jgi:hypothetical protein
MKNTLKLSVLFSIFLLSNSVFAVTEYKLARKTSSHIYHYYQCKTGEETQIIVRLSDEKTRIRGRQRWYSKSNIELAEIACKTPEAFRYR